MAAGIRLLLRWALLHLRDLYLHPEGSSVKLWLSGWVMSCVIVVAMRAMALLLSSERLGVGSPIILAAIFVIRVSLVRFLTGSMLKKQMEK